MWQLNGALNFLPQLWMFLILPVVAIAPFRRTHFTFVAALPVVGAMLLMGGTRSLMASEAACVEGEALRVVTANVLMSNDRLPELARDVLDESPDIVVFEELRHDLDTFSPALAQAYPYRISTETPWLTLASKLPLQSARRLTLSNPVPGREPLAATVEVGGRDVTVLAVHAQVPLSAETLRLHRDQYRLLTEEANRADGPVIAVGDFNATTFSPLFAGFLLQTGLRAASSGQEPTHYPKRHVGLRIDHVLMRGASACNEQVFHLTGSDHRGVAVGVMLGEANAS